MPRTSRVSPSPCLAALAVLAVVGCGGTSDVPHDMGRGQLDLGAIITPPPCGGLGTARYRITALHIPTAVDVSQGRRVGHNVDGTGTTCGVEDFPGGVDNALIDLSSELTTFTPPDGGFDFQAAIDAALNCPADAEPTTCTRLELFVSVHSGTACAVVAFEDGEGATLAGPAVGSLDGSGGLRLQAEGLALSIPAHTQAGVVSIDLAVSNLVMTATVGASELSDLVLGGFIERSAFETLMMELLPALGDGVTYPDIAPLLEDLYDVELGGMCSGLSLGFTGAATLVASP